MLVEDLLHEQSHTGRDALEPVLLELCEAAERDDVDARAFPSLSGLDTHRRRAALALAALALDPEDEAGAGFAEAVRLAYGPGREVAELASELLDLSGADPAEAGELARELSDLFEASRCCERDACRAGGSARVVGPVAQWLLWRRLCAADTQAEPAAGRPVCAAGEVEVMTRLGDHVGPAAPEEVVAASPPGPMLARLAGRAEPWSFVQLAGPGGPAEARAGADGRFGLSVPAGGLAAGVHLWAVDLAGNPGEPIIVQASELDAAGPSDPCTEPGAVEVFGPERYERAAGRPRTVTSIVHAPFAGWYCLRLVNGESDPPHGRRVSAAVVALDGRVVIGPDRFNQRVAMIEQGVYLEPGEHLLEVELRSKPGSFFVLIMAGLADDLEPPWVRIDSPADLAIVAGASVAVTGSATDEGSGVGRVEVNGVLAQLDGERFFAEVDLAAGVNLVEAVAWDRAGNSARAAITLYRGLPGELPEALGVVGPQGGRVEVDDPASPIFGAGVEVPAGAVAAGTAITIGRGPAGPGSPAGRVAIGPAVVFGSDGPFESEVRVVVPYSPGLLGHLWGRAGRVELWRWGEQAGWLRLDGEEVTGRGLVSGWCAGFSPIQAWAEYPQDLVLETLAGGGVQDPGGGGVAALDARFAHPSRIDGGWGDTILLNEPEVSAVHAVSGGLVYRLLHDPGSLPRESKKKYMSMRQVYDQQGRRWLYLGIEYWHQPVPGGGGVPWVYGLVRRLDLDTWQEEAVAGALSGDPLADGIPASEALLGTVVGLDVDRDGRVYFAERRPGQTFSQPRPLGHRVRRIDLDGTIWTVAGTGVGGFDGDDGPATALQLHLPEDANVDAVAVDGDLIFLADTGNHRVRAVNVSQQTVRLGRRLPSPEQQLVIEPGQMVTVVGEVGSLPDDQPTDCQGAADDGNPGRFTRLVRPTGVAYADRMLFVADACNRVLGMSIDDLGVTRLAGRPEEPPGYDGEGLGGLSSRLSGPRGLTFDWGRRGLWVADAGNGRVRSLAVRDSDGDGVRDAVDNCVAVPNRDQLDTDSDGVGDACDDDDDGDGVPDADDNCPKTPNLGQEDSDGDGIGDACDNCPAQPNAPPGCLVDADCEGAGEVCTQGRCPQQRDSDADMVGDLCDNCPQVENPDQPDFDGDRIGDACDDDDDDDGLPDLAERHLGTDPFNRDTDGDGVEDLVEFLLGLDPLSPDTDGDGIPDFDELDANGDGVFDLQDFVEPDFDSDGDGRPDAAECSTCDSDGDGLADHLDPVDDREIPEGEQWVVEEVWTVRSTKIHHRGGDQIVDLETTDILFDFRVIYLIEWDGGRFVTPADSPLRYRGDPNLMGEVLELTTRPIEEPGQAGECARYAIRSGMSFCLHQNCVVRNRYNNIRKGEYRSLGTPSADGRDDILFDLQQTPPIEDELDASTAHYREERRPLAGESGSACRQNDKHRHVLAAGLANEPEIPVDQHGAMWDRQRYPQADAAYRVWRERFLNLDEFREFVEFEQVLQQDHAWHPSSSYDRRLSLMGQVRFEKNYAKIHGVDTDDTLVHLCDSSNGHATWVADHFPEGGTFAWEIVEGEQYASIVSTADAVDVTLRSNPPGGSDGRVRLKVTYTTPEGVEVEDEKEIRVQEPWSSTQPSIARLVPYGEFGYAIEVDSYVLDNQYQVIVETGDADMYWSESVTPFCGTYEKLGDRFLQKFPGGPVEKDGLLRDHMEVNWNLDPRVNFPQFKRKYNQEIRVNLCRADANPIATRCIEIGVDIGFVTDGPCLGDCW